MGVRPPKRDFVGEVPIDSRGVAGDGNGGFGVNNFVGR